MPKKNENKKNKNGRKLLFDMIKESNNIDNSLDKENENKIEFKSSFLNSIPFPKIGIENYKVINNYQTFEFHPITLLVGQNSSGKSNLIELIKILGQNDRIDTLYLNKLAEKLGSFSKVISKNSNTNEFTISFLSKNIRLGIKTLVSCAFKINNKNKQKADLFHYSIEHENILIFDVYLNSDNNTSGYVNFKYVWELFKKEFENYKTTNVPSTFIVSNYFSVKNHNNIDISNNYFDDDFNEFPIFYFDPFNDVISLHNFLNENKVTDSDLDFFKLENEIFSEFYFNNKNVGTSNYFKNALKLLKENPYELLRNITNTKHVSNDTQNLLSKYLSGYNIKKSPRIQDLTNSHLYLMKEGVSEIDLHTIFGGEYSKEFNYKKIKNKISSESKAIIDKVVRKDSLKIEFLNFLNMLFEFPLNNNVVDKSLFIPVNRSVQKFSNQNLGSRSKYETFLEEVAVKYLELTDFEKEKINDHIKYVIQLFKIGDKAEIESSERGLEIIITKKDHKFYIAEEGFGISQLFSMILGICVNAIYFAKDEFRDEDEIREYEFQNKFRNDNFNLFKASSFLVCIEEPESNLHPNYQSLLADMLIYLSVEFQIQFIVETHSEYLFRRLRLLTHRWYKDYDARAWSAVPRDYWNSYYFNRNENVTTDNPKIFEIYVENEDGQMNRPFGEGFLDTATESQIEHIKLFSFKNLSNN